MKVYIALEENSCPVNYHHEYITNNLLHKVDICSHPSEADIIIFPSTCVNSVSRLEYTMNAMIDVLSQKKPGAKVYLTGCITREFIEPEIFAGVTEWITQNIDYVIPQNSPGIIINDILKLVDEEKKSTGFGQLFFDKTTGVGTLYISNGCQRKCAFCKTTFQKYPLTSLDIKVVKSMADFCNKEKISNLIIQGANISQYGFDLCGKPLLPEIIQYLENLANIETINLMGMGFADAINFGFADLLRDSRKIKVINGSLESGSDRILNLIGKGATAQEMVDFLLYISSKYNKDYYLPIIAGYPSETMEDLIKTLEVLSIIKPVHVDIAAYADSPFVLSHQHEGHLDAETIHDRARIYQRVLNHRGVHTELITA